MNPNHFESVLNSNQYSQNPVSQIQVGITIRKLDTIESPCHPSPPRPAPPHPCIVWKNPGKYLNSRDKNAGQSMTGPVC